MNQTTIQKKICLLGDFAVGKTSLVLQFVEGKFEDKYLSTIGVKISRKPLPCSYGTLNLLVWDLAGNNGHNLLSESSYVKGAAGALVVCDLTRPETLGAFERYARQLQAINPDTSLVFVANKVDLVDERVISDADLLSVCGSLNGGAFFLTSAKTGEQVEAAFVALADRIDAKK